MSNVTRCEWAAGGDELMLAYHDEEWGIAVARRPPPLRDAHARGCAGRPLVVDDPAQARGLPARVRRLRSAGRGRLHAGGRRTPARRSRDRPEPTEGRVDGEQRSAASSRCRRSEGSLDAYLWSFVDGTPIVNRWRTLSELPAETELSTALSKDLKRRGFRFVGPTVCYAFMQSVGMVDDHTVDCFRRA